MNMSLLTKRKSFPLSLPGVQTQHFLTFHEFGKCLIAWKYVWFPTFLNALLLPVTVVWHVQCHQNFENESFCGITPMVSLTLKANTVSKRHHGSCSFCQELLLCWGRSHVNFKWIWQLFHGCVSICLSIICISQKVASITLLEILHWYKIRRLTRNKSTFGLINIFSCWRLLRNKDFIRNCVIFVWYSSF
jgi:hypothetical protein